MARAHGLQAMTIDALASRLAGGFLQPIDPDSLKDAVTQSLSEDLGELDRIKDLPGFARAAAATLAKAWSSGVSFDRPKDPAAQARMVSFARLEQAVLKRLPPAMRRPADLVELGMARLAHAKEIFGPVRIEGRTEMSPVWRPLLTGLAGATDVEWTAGPRHVPDWVRNLGIRVSETPPITPDIRGESCASPRHEALEAMRWARALIVSKAAKPEEIAIAAASPGEWDDHFLALTAMSGVDLHFAHGRKALTTAEGQMAAALSEVLLRGLSHVRLTRLVDLLRGHNVDFDAVPPGWRRPIAEDAPLLTAASWREALNEATAAADGLSADAAKALAGLIDVLSLGLDQAAEIGERLLRSRARAIWRKALTEGPPAALDVTLATLRLTDDVPQETSIVWSSAAVLAAEPRPYVRLLGLTSQAWPRRRSEDPLLPDHIVPADMLDPLPVHEADRRDFDTIMKTTARQVVCSYARRDAQGRISGLSPLYPKSAPQQYLRRARIPAHAAGPSDRWFARPDEFKDLPAAKSALACWVNWHTDKLTPHDGLIRPNHPLVAAAVGRRQSATSLGKLLRDPLGYLWNYGFKWKEPEESEEPMLLEPLAFGNLLHSILEHTVNSLEAGSKGGFGAADEAAIASALDGAVREISQFWERRRPTPPPVIWRRNLDQARSLAFSALTFTEPSLKGQRSWAEAPFGVDRNSTKVSSKHLGNLPWDPFQILLIPGTKIAIGGSIDRVDIAGSAARVTDYKSGKPPSRGKIPILRGGTELQRCLYAFVVTSLVPKVTEVDARLLYPRAGEDGLFAMDDPREAFAKICDFVRSAIRHTEEGEMLPGAGAADGLNDLDFALPGGAKESYFDLKAPLIAKRLSGLSALWEME